MKDYELPYFVYVLKKTPGKLISDINNSFVDLNNWNYVLKITVGVMCISGIIADNTLEEIELKTVYTVIIE